MKISTHATMVFSLISCIGPEPSRNEVIGRWTNSDGAKLGIYADGRVEGDSLPTELFIAMRKDPDRCNCSGTWEIKEDQGLWLVEFKFDRLSCYHGTAFTSMIIHRRDDSVVLFKWEGEEGGARYEMIRE